MSPTSELTYLSLLVDDCAAAVDFYTAAFGGRETMRECLLDGHVLRAEVAVSCYRLRLSEQEPSPGSVDAPRSAAPVLEKADGDDTAAFLRDPFGYRWSLRFLPTA